VKFLIAVAKVHGGFQIFILGFPFAILWSPKLLLKNFSVVVIRIWNYEKEKRHVLCTSYRLFVRQTMQFNNTEVQKSTLRVGG
jgi:hypothetical protein